MTLSKKKSASDGSEINFAKESEDYVITKYFWHYLFLFGTQLGDEAFYALFFTFWFWNIDGAVGRRVVFVWNLVMYVGQALKDVIRLPRPSQPPVIQLETKWAKEYGMPSTHASIAVAIPFSIILFTMNRYQYPLSLGFWVLVACIWGVLVCCSRLYLGMHSIAELVAGILVTVLILFVETPIADELDRFMLTNPLSPPIFVGMYLLAIVFYPGSDRWTPARGDTTVILGSGLGVILGSFTNFYVGAIRGPPLPPPYPIFWPDAHMCGLAALRSVIGLAILILTRAVVKPLSAVMACAFLGTDTATVKAMAFDVKNKKKIIVELTQKLVTYVAIGFNVTFTAPLVYRMFDISRLNFHTEL